MVDFLAVRSRTIPIRVGDVELLVETSPVPGTEQTAVLDQARGRVVDAYTRAQDAIVEVASSMVDTIAKLTARAARPDGLEVEFGLKFGAQGNVIIAGGSGEAALRVLVRYDLAPRSAPRVAGNGSDD